MTFTQVGTFVWILAGLSTLNAVYTMNRTRKYRFFEADVEKEQAENVAQAQCERLAVGKLDAPAHNPTQQEPKHPDKPAHEREVIAA